MKAVTIMAKARELVSRRLKSRSILMPIIQATNTHNGTWSIMFTQWLNNFPTDSKTGLIWSRTPISWVVNSHHKHCNLSCRPQSNTQRYILHLCPMNTFSKFNMRKRVVLIQNSCSIEKKRKKDHCTTHQLVLKGEYDCSSMFCSVSNYGQQDYADEADRNTPRFWCNLVIKEREIRVSSTWN